MPVFSFQSAVLTPELASTAMLRMVVGVNGASLLVKKEEKILALKSWQISGPEQSFEAMESELRSVFGAERLLELPFKDKVCALSCALTTLTPRRLFNADNLAQYFKLLVQPGVNRSYGFEFLEAFDCYLVWAAETGLLNLCGQYFQSAQIGHIAVPLIKSCHKLAPESGYGVFANLHGQKVQVIVFERRNLVFFNTFDFSKPSDLLYFILLAYKQFDLNPLEIPLTLSGTLIEDSEIFRLLLRYIRPMRFPPFPNGLQLPEEARVLPPHYWFELATI